MTVDVENCWSIPLLWSRKCLCQQIHHFKGHLLTPPFSFLLSSLSFSLQMFLVFTRLWRRWFGGGVLAFSACDRAVIHTVCKPSEHCLNTPQPLFHPTHTREPNNTSKLPPIAPLPPPAPKGRRGDNRGNLLMIHVSINRSSDARSASLRAVNAASRLNLLKNYIFPCHWVLKGGK